MNIYLVERTEWVDYDEYDSVVVVAESREEARKMIPSRDAKRYWNKLSVSLIGTAVGKKKKFVLKSFCAG